MRIVYNPVPHAKKIGAVIVAIAIAGTLWAQTFNIEEPQGVKYVLTDPDSGEFPGQIIVNIGDAQDPIMKFWNQNDGAWEELGGDAAGLTLADLTVTNQVSVAGGSVSDPAIVWTDDDDGTGTGFYRIGTNVIAVSSNGVLSVAFRGNNTRFPSGTAAAPGIGFNGDVDTGAYIIGSNNLGLSAGGALQVDINDDRTDFQGGVTYQAFRDDFDFNCFVGEAADDTTELVIDDGVNHAYCRTSIDPFGLYHFKLDGDQASPFIITGGQLDIDNDAAGGEGVNMVFAHLPTTTGGYQARTAAYYFRISIDVADVSDLNVYHFGFRLNEAYIDDQVLATQRDYAGFSIPGGTASAVAATDDTDQTELESSCDIGDTETWVFEVRVSATGVPTFYCAEDNEADLALLTTPTSIGPFASGDVMVPYIAYDSTAGTTEIKINFIEVGLN